jgi:hypothetical protein
MSEGVKDRQTRERMKDENLEEIGFHTLVSAGKVYIYFIMR